MDTNKSLLLSEYFGPTIQGEGKSVGTRALFIRTYSCNLGCTFCDTPFSWRVNEKQPHRSPIVYDKHSESHWVSFEDLADWIDSFSNVPLLVITGGEPLIQKTKILDFIKHLKKLFGPHIPKIEMETAGTIDPEELFDHCSFNVSPKLENSGNPKAARYKPEILKKFAYNGSSFKFVFTEPNDLIEIKEIMAECGIPNSNVYIMFEGETREKQLARMERYADFIIQNDFNISPRLHSLIWGNKRGV